MEKRNIVIVFIISFLLLGSAPTFIYIYTRPAQLATPCNLSQIQTGDLIISAGHSLKSDIVRLFHKDDTCNTEYSHIGIFTRKENSVNIVHMSIDDGHIKKESIDSFITNNIVLKYDIYRISKPITDTKRLYSIIDSLLYINKQFDRLFDINSEDAYYCTEFVYKSFLKAGITDIEGIVYDKYLYPNDFASSDIFTRISY